MNGIIKDTLKENIEWMMGGEKSTTTKLLESAEPSLETVTV